MGLKKIPISFDGKGEVSGFRFRRIGENDKGYVYEVSVIEIIGRTNAKHYEVIKKNKVKICLDFDNKIYSETDFKETYPKAKSFGKSAWTTKSKDRALEILKNL